MDKFRQDIINEAIAHLKDAKICLMLLKQDVDFIDQAMDKITEIIKASEPPELDAPDCEGWWWLKHSSGIEAIKVQLIEGRLVAKYDGELYDIYELDGKWQKAICPNNIINYNDIYS